ncbi:Cell division control protein [Spatholobus suberectus]|nr:Cell division control protein [Spatholobus suberectus]
MAKSKSKSKEIEMKATSSTSTKLSARDIYKLAPTPDQLKALKMSYTDFHPVGAGEHGTVFRCKRHSNDKDFFAIKIIPISKQEQENGVPYRIIREVSLLKEMEHVNIVRLKDVMATDDDLFLVFEYLDNSLHAFLRNPVMFLYPKMMRNFLHQIISAVAYIHSCKILHRDLNAENILLQFSTRIVKIADFGAARTFEVPLESYSKNVGSPSYRAPELLFGSANYSTPNDVWSVGCIFGEMVLRRPVFSGGSDWELLDKIFTLLGTPTEETWPGVTSLCGSISAMGPPKQPKDLRIVFADLEDPAGHDLLSKLLCLCPNYRISAEEAVKHPYFEGI